MYLIGGILNACTIRSATQNSICVGEKSRLRSESLRDR